MKSCHHLCAQRTASMLQSRITSWFLTKLEQCRSRSGKPGNKMGENWLCLFVCNVISSGLCIYSMFRNLWINDFEKSKRSTESESFWHFKSLSLFSSAWWCITNLTEEPFLCQLPSICPWGSQGRNIEVVSYFPSPVDHILSELSTMAQLSWLALHSMAHSLIKLDKAVAHVISLISFLWLWFSFCLAS